MEKIGYQVSGREVYVNPRTKNAKVGYKERVRDMGDVFGSLTRGQARKLRKHLRCQGHICLASISRNGDN